MNEILHSNGTAVETVCFTGHRSIRHDDALLLPTKLKAALEALISRGARRFRAGGAMGFDTVAALCVLELQEKYPSISLDLILPCRDQSKLWNDQNRAIYESIIASASTVSYVSDYFTAWCMHERNRRLVDGSQVCIAYLKHSGGGTAYTFSYALTRGLEVINLGED